MAKTYELSDTNSDLTIGGAFTDTLNTSPSGSNTITAAQGGGVNSGYYAAAANDPSSSGTSTGTFTAVLNVSAAVGSTQARCYLLRVNSSGVTQTEVLSPTGYVSTATTGDKTWSWTDPALGTWAAGDRIVLRVEVQNNNAHGGAAGPTFSHTSANTRLDTPFVLTVAGAVNSPVTFGAVTVGKLEAKAATASPLTWSSVVEGRRERLGAVVTPIVFGFFVDGAVEGGAGDHFGAVVSPLTFSFVTNGTRTRFGAIDLPLALTVTPVGYTQRFASAALAFGIERVVAGKLEAFADVLLPLALGISTDGFVGDQAAPPELGRRRLAITQPSETLTTTQTGRTRATVLSGAA